jgi:undecaprenyl-diphosphatase
MALTVSVVTFAAIAEEVAGGGALAAFDLAFAQALQQATAPGWQRLFALVSWLGSAPVLAVAAGIVAVGLFRHRRPMLAGVWIAGQAGGGLLNLALKQVFARTRPEFADPLLVPGWSFPSGHAMGTFVFFGLGAYLLLRRTRSWTATYLIVGGSLLWCVLMSFSRLYLGVHFATDVVAGLIAGAGWVVVCVSGVELALQREARVAAAGGPGPPNAWHPERERHARRRRLQSEFTRRGGLEDRRWGG